MHVKKQVNSFLSFFPFYGMKGIKKKGKKSTHLEITWFGFDFVFVFVSSLLFDGLGNLFSETFLTHYGKTSYRMFSNFQKLFPVKC